MPKSYVAPTVGGGKILSLRSSHLAKELVVAGDCLSHNAEVAITSADGAVTLMEPFQNLMVRSTVPAYVAKTSALLASAPDGTKQGGRFFLPANEWRVLPWWQDEVHFKSQGAAGTLYIEGRI